LTVKLWIAFELVKVKVANCGKTVWSKLSAANFKVAS